jgi:hypothetical protein
VKFSIYFLSSDSAGAEYKRITAEDDHADEVYEAMVSGRNDNFDWGDPEVEVIPLFSTT